MHVTVVLAFLLLVTSTAATAGIDPSCAYCGKRSCRNECVNGSSSSRSAGGTSGHGLDASDQVMVAACGTLFSSLFDGLMGDPAADARAEQVRAEEQKRLQELLARQAKEREEARLKGLAAWRACRERQERERREFMTAEERRLRAVAERWQSLDGSGRLARWDSLSDEERRGRFHPLGGGAVPSGPPKLKPMGWKEPGEPFGPMAGGTPRTLKPFVWKEPGEAFPPLPGASPSSPGGAETQLQAMAGTDPDAAERAAAVFDGREGAPTVDPRDLKRGAPSDGTSPGEPIQQAEPTPPPTREERLRALPDKDVLEEAKRTQRLLDAMVRQGQRDSGALDQWVADSQQAQAAALLASVKLLSGAVADGLGNKLADLPVVDGPMGTANILRLARGLKTGQTLQELKEIEGKLEQAKDPSLSAEDRRAALEAGQSALSTAYQYFSYEPVRRQWSAVSSKIGGAGSSVTALAEWAVDYGYQATKWELARRRMAEALAVQERGGGSLASQKRIAELNQAELRELKRRGIKYPTLSR